MDAKFAAEIVTDEPVENEAGAQQHTSSAGGAGDVAGYGPNEHVRRSAHHRGRYHRDDHSNSIKAVFDNEVVDQGGHNRTAEVSDIVYRC